MNKRACPLQPPFPTAPTGTRECPPRAPTSANPRARLSGVVRMLLASMVLIGLLLASGCDTLMPADQVMGPSYLPSNFTVREPILPRTLHRVAVLPVTVARNDADLIAGKDALEDILFSELVKCRRFELARVSGAELERWSGRASWTPSDRLPTNLVERIKEEKGVEAVVFAQITVYRAYTPMAMGWSLRLVDSEPNATIWAVDEVFDAGTPHVVNGARRFQQQEAADARPLVDSMGILASPRRFGQYMLHTLLETLPGR